MLTSDNLGLGSSLQFSCHCGQVTGTLFDTGPNTGDHIVCHCGDCQNFARHLGAEERILQDFGGTELYQSRCAKMKLVTGAAKLACLHLTDQSTLRWYAACCRTPMFNTYANGRIPYLTTLVANCDPSLVKGILGPVVGHLFLPDTAGDLPHMSMNKLMRRFFVRMVRDVFSGDRRRSALFDTKTLLPKSPPHRLTEAERRALD
jgi:hypothetical protein